MAAVASAGLVSPMPPPATRKPASRAVQSSPGSTPLMSSSPMPTSASPPARNQRTPTLLGELAGDRRDRERHQRDRQEAQAGLERPVAEDVLHVEREVEEHREHRRRQHEGGDEAPQKAGLRNSERSRIGWRTRRSISTKATSSTAAPARQARMAALQSSALPRMSPNTARKSAAENAIVPAQSSGSPCGSRDSSTRASVSAMARDADRQVDEEDRLPAAGLDEHAADQRPDRHGGARSSLPTARSRCRGRGPGRR